MPTVILRPNQAGDRTEWPWQYPSTGEHWDKVDDVTPDEDSTYIYISRAEAGSHKDLYNLPSPGIPSGAQIDYVRVYIRCRGSGFTFARARPVIKTHGMEYAPTYMSFGTSYSTQSHEWTTNPYTGEAWTLDELESLQAGVEGVRGMMYDPWTGLIRYDDTYCTQVYVEIGYTEVVVAAKRYVGDGIVWAE